MEKMVIMLIVCVLMVTILIPPTKAEFGFDDPEVPRIESDEPQVINVINTNVSIITNTTIGQNSSVWNRSGTDVILANTGDNVGIGTTSPTEKLHVDGNVQIDGNITMPSSFFMGSGTASIDNGILYNYAIGHNAHASNYYSISLGAFTDCTANSGICIGYDSDVSGTYATAVGRNADVLGNSGVAFGTDSKVGTGSTGSIAIGRSAEVSAGHAFSFAMGYEAYTDAATATAIGLQAQSLGGYSFALGPYANASGTASYAIGHLAKAENDASMALGKLAYASGSSAFALGYGANATNTDAFAFGRNAVSDELYSIAIGREAETTANNQMMIGSSGYGLDVIVNNGDLGVGTPTPSEKLHVTDSVQFDGNITMPTNFFIGSGSTNAEGINSIAIGTNVDVNTYYGVGLGSNIETAAFGIGIGYDADATGTYSTTVGPYAKSTATGCATFGYSADCTGTYGSVFGNEAQVSQTQGFAMGYYSNSYGIAALALGALTDANDYSAAIGQGSQATGLYATAIGGPAYAEANFAQAYGYKANASHLYSMALGREAKTTETNQMVIGSTDYSLDVDIVNGDFDVQGKADFNSTTENSVRIVGLGTPLSSPFTFSIQNNAGDNDAWFEILNGIQGQGAFFGMNSATGTPATGDAFELWNYQGGETLFYNGIGPGSSIIVGGFETDSQGAHFRVTGAATDTPSHGQLQLGSVMGTGGNYMGIRRTTGNHMAFDLWSGATGHSTKLELLDTGGVIIPDGSLEVQGNVNITENLTTTQAFFGEDSNKFNKTKLYGYGNVRIGTYYNSYGTILIESTPYGGIDSVWGIDNAGDNIRIYDPTTGYAKFRVNDTEITAGEPSIGREVDWRITGNTYAEGNLDQTSGNSTINMIYGEMWNYSSHTSPWTFDITKDDVYFNFTGLAMGDSNGFTFTSETQVNGGSYLTTEVAGLYKIDLSMSFASNNVGGTFGIAVVEDFAVDNHRDCYARREASTDIGNAGVTCLMDLDIGSIVNIQVENEDNTRDMVIHTVNLNLLRIGN